MTIFLPTIKRCHRRKDAAITVSFEGPLGGQTNTERLSFEEARKLYGALIEALGRHVAGDPVRGVLFPHTEQENG